MQQQPCEFMKYIPCPGEKFLGIAIIRYERRFIFRFKILPSEKGGYWATTASMKTGSANGKDKYEPAFSLDSDYEKSQMLEFVISCVEKELAQKVAPQASVFQQPVSHAYQAPQQQQSYQQNGQAYTQAINAPFNDDNIPF